MAARAEEKCGQPGSITFLCHYLARNENQSVVSTNRVGWGDARLPGRTFVSCPAGRKERFATKSLVRCNQVIYGVQPSHLQVTTKSFSPAVDLIPIRQASISESASIRYMSDLMFTLGKLVINRKRRHRKDIRTLMNDLG